MLFGPYAMLAGGGLTSNTGIIKIDLNNCPLLGTNTKLLILCTHYDRYIHTYMEGRAHMTMTEVTKQISLQHLTTMTING